MGYISIADRRTLVSIWLHDLKRSQTIAEDRTWFYILRSSAIVCDHDRRIAGSQAIAEVCFHMIAGDRRTFCDLRSVIRDRLRSYGNQPLGPDYMANFIPGWNFSPANRDEISDRPSETNPLETKLSITRRRIQPGLKILARYTQTGLGLSARPNGPENLKKVSCNRNGISARAEKGTRVFALTVFSHLRAWLHGEFQPGLKFRSAHRAEILLRLHAQFQPGRKTQISVRKFTEVRKHNRYACSRSFFSPGWKNDSDYMVFQPGWPGWKS